jgi:hypothetical protein
MNWAEQTKPLYFHPALLPSSLMGVLLTPSQLVALHTLTVNKIQTLPEKDLKRERGGYFKLSPLTKRYNRQSEKKAHPLSTKMLNLMNWAEQTKPLYFQLTHLQIR